MTAILGVLYLFAASMTTLATALSPLAVDDEDKDFKFYWNQIFTLLMTFLLLYAYFSL